MIRVKGPRLLILPREPPAEVHEAGSPDLILTGASDGGLITAAFATQRQPQPTMGKVLQVGTEAICPHCHKGKPCEVSVGDVVVFKPSAGEFVYFEDQRYLILPYEDVEAVMEPLRKSA